MVVLVFKWLCVSNVVGLLLVFDNVIGCICDFDMCGSDVELLLWVSVVFFVVEMDVEVIVEDVVVILCGCGCFKLGVVVCEVILLLCYWVWLVE